MFVSLVRRSLCQKFPRKHSVMMNFLASMLRDEGGFEYKKAIVDTVIHIIEDNPDAKEAGELSTFGREASRSQCLECVSERCV